MTDALLAAGPSLVVGHKDAVIARLHDDEILAGCGYEGVVNFDTAAERPQKYWTIFTDSGLRFADRLDGLPSGATLHYTIHCIGQRPEQAQRLSDRVIALLAGAQLTVPGFAPGRIAHSGSEPARMDTTIRPPLHYTVDRFDLRTQPV